MNQARQAVNDEADPLAPPAELSTEERWIVRMHGKDMGPFSSQALYPMLLRGEIDPDTLLLDQNRFSRCRMSEVEEFHPYLGLHNTQNPILLDEAKQQERERHWEEVGRKRMIISIFAVVAVLVSGFMVWRFFIYKPEDIYLTDDNQKFAISLGKFQAHNLKKKKQYSWKWKSRYRGRRSRGKGKSSKKAGPAGPVMDFTKAGGSIPKAELHGIISRKIRSVYGCFLSQIQRDSSFGGGTVVFNISGTTGRVRSVRMESGGHGVLVRCIRRRSGGWSFPKFLGNAEIYIPVHLNRRRRF